MRDRDLSETCGVEAVTVEVLAAWIHERLAAPLGGDGAEVVSVRVWESEDAFGGIRATRLRSGRGARCCGSRW